MEELIKLLKRFRYESIHDCGHFITGSYIMGTSVSALNGWLDWYQTACPTKPYYHRRRGRRRKNHR
jgi:hypothetical protein